MKNYKNLIYALLCLSFSAVIGAGVYEHLSVWPIAFDSPPQSLSMFQGEFGLNPGLFWQKIHPITLLLFIVTLLITWKTKRKKYVLIALIGYVFTIIFTFTYFVPELMEIVNTEYDNIINQDLVQRGALWEKLSVLRIIIAIGLALTLYLGLTKSNEPSLPA